MEQNLLFEAIEREDAPMYDATMLSGSGEERWQSDCAHMLNNTHSAAKLFIAAGIGALWGDGRLSLEDNVTSFFPESAFPEGMDERWRRVRVYDALRHRTGMEDAGVGVDELRSHEKIGDDFLGHVFRIPLPHEPGAYRQYSDAAYYLLSRIIASVSGVPADRFLDERFFRPMRFGQWCMVRCPAGHPIGGGGFFCHSSDMVKMGWLYANGGVWNGTRLLSAEWIDRSMEEDFALSRFRDTDIFLKTGSRGQIVAFDRVRRFAVSWHGCADPVDEGRRNDRLLEAFDAEIRRRVK